MTEKRGGSDVSNGTETYAVVQNDSMYKLYGYKWFSSANDSDCTITLGRTMNADKTLEKGLTMFFARTRNDDGSLNGIEVQKLKNKLGTRQLPTAELLLDGMVSYRMSEIGKGVSKMTSMLNITRIHNSIWAISNMRRAINLARDYATKRKAFGKFIINHSLHCQTLGNMEVECRASLLSLLFVAKLLGKSELNEANSEELELLRFSTPLLKSYTAKQSISVASECIEAFGGQGFIEDTGIPNFLRDAQVLSIWEGTTNILSLDVLRSIQKSNGASLEIFAKHVEKTCERCNQIPKLNGLSQSIQKALKDLTVLVRKTDPEIVQTGAREFSFSLYRLLTGSFL
jgi:alkylation response protein AidB-like acyl-CoA dehydrogenase